MSADDEPEDRDDGPGDRDTEREDGDGERGKRGGDPIPAAVSERRTPEDTALLVDDMLGKLSTYLRMCGYDATYTTDRGVDTDEDVFALAHTEDRLVVTRDTDLARRADRAVLLSAREVDGQLRELRDAGLELSLAEEPVRCSACNGLLEGVDRTEPTPDYAPDPHEKTVWRCRECGQHFWRGSHWDDVAATLSSL